MTWPPLSALFRQYLYFRSSKARTFVLVRQTRLLFEEGHQVLDAHEGRVKDLCVCVCVVH